MQGLHAKVTGREVLPGLILIFLYIAALCSCATGPAEHKPPLSIGGRTAVAVVNGVPINIEQIDRGYHTEFLRYGKIAQSFSKARKRELRQAALQNLINAELLYQNALIQGTVPLEERIAAVYEQIASRFASEDELEVALRKQGLSIDTLREDIHRSAVVETYMETLSAAISVSDEEIAHYYKKNRASFEASERVKIGHILVEAPHDAPPAEVAEAEKKVKAVHLRLSEGQSFAQLARKYSDAPEGANGGELPFLTRGRLIGPLNKAAFQLEPGSFSEPIRSRLGYHLILVKERREAGIRPPDEMAEAIARNLFVEKQRNVTEALLKKLRTFGSVITYSLPSGLPPDPKM
ncbi:peptidylprolyl isomerase [Candidatus Hydrogenedentota bacterium]